MYATKKRILLLCCTLLFFYGQAFSQYEVLSPPWTGILVKDVCWAKGNVDKPGTLVDRPLKVGMLYQWNHQGWIATNPFLENDTIIAVGNPCPAGWRMPTVEESMSFEKAVGKEITGIHRSGEGIPPSIRDEFMWQSFTCRVGGNYSALCFPVLGFLPANAAATPMYGYWTETLDTEDSLKAWGYAFFDTPWTPQPVLAPRDYAFFIRCVKEKCDTIVVDTAVAIFAEDLPYKWGDTTFQVGTKSGTYRFQQSNCAYHRTVNLHLTVKSCPGVLINNVCWAKSNVDEPGTFAATPESYGMLYQWNRKKGWPVTGEVSGWDNSSEPGDIWEAVNDPCPAGWRIPTVEEMKTLLSSKEVTSIPASQNGVAGMTFTDKTTGSSIFLPESYLRAGFDGGSVLLKGSGNYWSSSHSSESAACQLYFYESNAFINNPFKYYGLSVRCVVGPVITDTSVIVCAKDLPYTWCDTIFDIGTESGTYSFQYASAVTGNDSIVNLHLTVQQPYETLLYDTLCQGDSYDKYGFSLSEVQEDDVYTLPLLSQAGCDSTVLLHLKVWQIRDTTVYDTICQGNGYYQHGLNLASVTESLVNERTLKTVHGCDSTVTLHLKVWQIRDTTVYDTICEGDGYRGYGFHLPEGTSGGTFTETYPTVHGCDSTVTLRLYVSPTYFNAAFQSVCEGDAIDFRGRRLSASGVYDDTLTTVHGCDSIYRLTLTVHPAYDLSFSDAVCRGSDYHNHGFDLTAVTADTIVRDTLQTRWGCDSVRTLSLAVHPVYNKIFYDTICEGDGYRGYGFHLPEGTSGGTFTETYPTVHGCDSTVALRLYVSPTYFNAAFQSICEGDAVNFRGRRLCASGVYDDTLTTVHGCDSIYRLTLTVHPAYDLSFSDAVCRGSDYHNHGFDLTAVTTDTIVRDTLQSRWGCDSVRTLFLTVHPVYNKIFYDTICEGDGYRGYGFHLPEGTSGGTFTETYPTVHGCDSTVTLRLYVSPTYFNAAFQSVCEGDAIDFRGRRLSASGVYDDTLTTVHGCDSIYRLTLTVHPAYDLSFSDAVCRGSDYHNHGFDLTAVTADTIVRDTLQTRWGCDSVRTLFLTVHPVYNKIFYDTICEGDGYRGYGFHLPEGTSGGTFTETYPTVHGCDSTVTLRLYVSPTYFNAAFQSVCEGDAIDFRGRRLYASGVYDDTLTTVHGCDSIFRLTLTVHPAHDLSFSDAVCRGSDYHGYGFDLTAVTADTIVRDTLQSRWGCDSVRTLFLSVNPLYETHLYDTVCEGDPYTGYGFNVTEAGTHVLRLQSIHGCDSVVTLHLTVRPVFHPTVRDSVCPSERYDRYGFHLSDIRKSGTYRLPLQTVHGCDSTVTLELYVYRSHLFPESQSVCEGDTVDFRGRRLYASGIYYDSLRTIHRCDSIYSLDLSVHPVYDVRLSGVLCEGNPYTGYGFDVTEAGTHVRRLQSVHGCDSVVTLTLTEEKKIQGSVGFLLDDCSTHGYSFFLDRQRQMMIDTWQWDMGDGTVYRSEEGFHQYADSGVYRIRLLAETHSGCENRFSHVQHVPFYLPEVSVHADRRVIDEEFPAVRFHTDVPQDMACEWDFGDGTTARGDSVSHTFDAVTRKYYDVTLRVMNADSCVTESGTRIEVVFLPKTVNTFTPNGDGVNDIFMAGYRIEVTDRNGRRIYAGDDGWDGTVNGRRAPQDTYFFRLYYRTANGERMKTGYVTLIR